METLKDRLRRARKYAGLSQEELANAVGITQGVISHIESGESSGSKHLIAIARALKVNPTWLSEGYGDMLMILNTSDGQSVSKETSEAFFKMLEGASNGTFSDDEAKILRDFHRENVRETLKINSGVVGEFIEIPETRVNFSAGDGVEYSVVDDENGSKASYRIDWFTKEQINPDNCIRIKVRGDSMEKLFYDGDVALINLDETNVIDGCVYALRWQDSLFIKRLAVLPGVGLRMMSENPIYDTTIIKADDVDEQVQILGRVRDKSGRGGL